uniref:NADH dehydrogenase subunit 6 n=1 Tax=Notiophilus quadripunctatus TaxID=2713611 RepID=UPI00207A6E4E|nr:NADH dehydrogenase subunit 6 [Notiophilus quadripunctatus]URQ84672.1 NADH deshydrogenase subunit 6 [Notiophilus quadripunctatus]
MMNLSLTMIFMFLNHPLSMGMILLMQTIIIALITGLFSYSYWFSYILFLIMVGGMLVLFIYMTSLASNEMFKYSNKLFILLIMSYFTMLFLYLLIDYLSINTLFLTSNSIELYNKILMIKNENMISLNKIYNMPNNMITLMLVNYLFLTLIAVVKITNINYGPLRRKF